MRDIIVKFLVKLGLYQSVVEVINHLKFKVQARRMKKDGLEMLVAADKVCSQIGVKAFLTYGTLLGAYRDHGFISYDPDIDLGVLANEVPKNMHTQMADAGFKLIRQNVMAKTGLVVEETYEYKKLHLDIFFYIAEGNDFFSIIQCKHETKDWKEANATDGFPCERSYVPACEFERREFLGLNIYMPVDTEGWLCAMYSDSYMTPIKNWNNKDGYVTRRIHLNERSYRKILC